MNWPPCQPHTLALLHISWQYVEAKGMPTDKSDLPQGTLDLLILKVVALGPIHGYAIAQRLEQVSRGVVQIPQGSMYPALHRLENRGLLDADWKETETGREAKFYKLTRKGRAQLESETASWERLAVAVKLILAMSEGGGK
jgi:transcriptional regulator